MEAQLKLRAASSKTTRNFNSTAAIIVLAALSFIGAWSVQSIGISLSTLADSLDNATAFLSRMFPLDFPPIGDLLSMVLETLAIVFLATLLSVVLSIPLALWAAKATSPSPAVQVAARSLIVLARTLPDLVLAIVFLRLFGLGAMGGILAMGIHSVGMVAKLYSDAIEELDDGPRESIQSAGGTRNQQITTSIPQVLMPQIIATALHRFDINLRTSVLLGYVGVGGIGLAISESLQVMNYQRGMALALVVLGLCIFIELLSGALRTAIMKSSGQSLRRHTWVDRLFESRARPPESGHIGG